MAISLGLVLSLCWIASPFDAQAQPTDKVYRVGYLGNVPPAAQTVPGPIVFLEALREHGYVEGRNLAIERRFGEGRVERYRAVAAELVALNVDVIVVGSGTAARAARDATLTIPIVMAGVGDPVGQRLVASLAHPGGNITGVADDQLDLFPKRLELLKAAFPKVARVISLGTKLGIYSAAEIADKAKEERNVGQSLGITILRVNMNTPQEFDEAASSIRREHPDALMPDPNTTNYILRKEIAQFATSERLPTMSASREEVAAGSMMSYGPDVAAMFRAAATYVDKILKGANPADLPVEQSRKYELVVNLKTAAALGIVIPRSLLLRADEVIR